MVKKRVAVLHYMPLELYPPVMNLIKVWQERQVALEITVYSTSAYKKLPSFIPVSNTARVMRFGVSGKKRRLPARMMHYLYYYLAVFCRLLVTKPANVLYYDTISSFPALLYKMLRGSRCQLFVHYNEYMSAAEYQHGMFLVRWFHKLEKKIYPQTAWLSHTNQERLDMFNQDMSGIRIPHQHVLPNFPPADWAARRTGTGSALPVKIIYAGALSMDTMYTRAFAEWVLHQAGKVTWDIYSLNTTTEAQAYISTLPAHIIQLHEGVSYYELPGVLQRYDVGVILYNGHIPNYIFNAPNKLFEYAAVGLDVWFPDHMQSSRQYVTQKTFPAITALDFLSLHKYTVTQLRDRSGYHFQQNPFACEQVLTPLLGKLAG